MATVLAALATIGLGLAGCSDGEPRSAGRSPIFDGTDDPLFLGVRGSAPTLLQQDRDCDAVLEDFQTFAPAVLRGWFGGFDGSGVAVAEEAADFDAGEDAAAAPDATNSRTAEGAGSGGDTSDTNTQEEGIDEPDVVETDGEFVYVVDQQELVILDGSTGDVRSRTPLKTWGAELLLSGDRVLAISGGGYGFRGGPGVAIDDVAVDRVEPAPDALLDPGTAEPVPVEPVPVEPPFPVGTVIELIDVADRSAPRVLETTEIEGSHVDTRVVDGVARVVVTSYPEPPQLFETRVESQDEAEQAIDDAVSDTTIEDWLPSFRTLTEPAEGAPSSIEGPLVECPDVLVPEVNAGIAETSVLRVDFEDGFDPADTTTVVAEPGTVYASASTLYLAATQWVTPDQQGEIAAEDWSTAIHAFDLGGERAATHAAAGEVPGSTLNQYSLSEYDGRLRVATTEGTPWGTGESESGVHVLERRGDELAVVGSVGGLGVTETIQSVRFMGPVGYVVTFRQTDPLYVIDLSDPTAPAAVGELKIPGFSSYLHPVGEGRLIGVGRDADLEGIDRGFLLSLFDVSDPTDPRQLQTWTAPDAWSQAGNDPHAFLWWGPESAAILPLERYQEPTPNGPEDVSVGMTVFDVDDSGISVRGTVTADGRYPSRAIVVEGRLWSLFDGGATITAFDDLRGGTFHPYR